MAGTREPTSSKPSVSRALMRSIVTWKPKSTTPNIQKLAIKLGALCRAPDTGTHTQLHANNATACASHMQKSVTLSECESHSEREGGSEME